MNRPFPRKNSFQAGPRINGKIRAREVRVIGPEGQQLGVLPLGDAIRIAQQNGVDLVEVAPNAVPPVCRVVDYGKFRYEQSKKEKESKKHQHANKVKEIQLSPVIDPHDFKTKMQHAIEFLCEEMKVKLALRFRGREMAHTEFGFQVINKFIEEVAPWAHPDSQPRLAGRSINVMLSPLPRAKRAKNPHEAGGQPPAIAKADNAPIIKPVVKPESPQPPAGSQGFANNPFSGIDLGSKPPRT